MTRRDKIAALSARPAWTLGEVALFVVLGAAGAVVAAVLGWHKGVVTFAAPVGVTVLNTAGNAAIRAWQMRRRR